MTPRKSATGRTRRLQPAWLAKGATWLDLGLFVLGTVLVVLFLQATSPRFGQIVYNFADLPPQKAELPLLVDTAAPTLHIHVPVTLTHFSPRRFLIKPDDCIESLYINKVLVPASLARYCDYDEGRILNLSGYLQTGHNILQFVIRDDGGKGGLNITVAANDPLHIGAMTIFVMLFLWYAGALIGHLRVPKERRALAWVFIGGALLRVLYVLATPYRTRSYDVDGHLDYIRFVADAWRIPPASQGWEFHQPPLYYWLSAMWVHIQELLGRTLDRIYVDLQAHALLFSIATLLVCVWMATMLFPRNRSQKWSDALCFAMMCCLPAFVMFASRVTNESLLQLPLFFGFACLLAWWHSGRWKMWLLAMAGILVAALCKISALALLPIAGLCLLVHPMLSRRQKLRQGAAAALLFVTLFAWYPVYRFTEKNIGKTITLGNKDMNPDLLVTRRVEDYLTFNPIAVAQLPFNDTWSDKYRRSYFWEFFFKSSYFGEFRFEKIYPLGTALTVLGMLLLPVLLWGLLCDLRKRWFTTLPMWTTSAILLAAALAYPTFFTYAPNQDFRFSILLVVPFAYYTVRGWQELPLIRRVLTCVMLCWMATVAAFFIALYFRLNI